MDPRNSLASLFQEYADLQSQSIPPLTADQQRSLLYFRAEQAMTCRRTLIPRDLVGRWVHHLIGAVEFTHRTEHLPRENNRAAIGEISHEERMLADWLRYQRRPATRALHCDYQRRRLECVQGFSWDPHGERWSATYARFLAFVEEHRRAPRYRSTDLQERAIAAWAAKQRHLIRRGALPQDRAQKLDQLTFRLVKPPLRKITRHPARPK